MSVRFVCEDEDCFMIVNVSSLHLKEEAHEYLEAHRIKDLIKKYSQFINFPIYLWESKVTN